MIHKTAGNSPKLEFFVTSYTISGNRALENGMLFIVLCIIGNLINVIMEEGVFRGLFNKLATEKYSFVTACTLSSLLFGFWHIAQPIRNVIDGSQSIMGAVMASVLLVGTSTLLGIQYSMLWKMTGSLWVGMAAHFANNTSVNLLHVTTTNGIDEFQVMRITIAQTLSFVVVLVLFIFYQKTSKKTVASNMIR